MDCQRLLPPSVAPLVSSRTSSHSAPHQCDAAKFYPPSALGMPLATGRRCFTHTTCGLVATIYATRGCVLFAVHDLRFLFLKVGENCLCWIASKAIYRWSPLLGLPCLFPSL